MSKKEAFQEQIGAKHSEFLKVGDSQINFTQFFIYAYQI